ncbi:ShET2/EspL2 family type III secretion system effector toxin [uncultured Endozoicomonas sp.]|uniref:ShET2/EspL2 family type III secretion system effector toxin n=1 Tax=uncultured Endozoicomonas sp. TaxID=432652 RepID=UPI0026172F10|nr:ShET2/EspL2 family type III secretion system effector toxin [uncultured Endozoicomonas sp.]
MNIVSRPVKTAFDFWREKESQAFAEGAQKPLAKRPWIPKRSPVSKSDDTKLVKPKEKIELTTRKTEVVSEKTIKQAVVTKEIIPTAIAKPAEKISRPKNNSALANSPKEGKTGKVTPDRASILPPKKLNSDTPSPVKVAPPLETDQSRKGLAAAKSFVFLTYHRVKNSNTRVAKSAGHINSQDTNKMLCVFASELVDSSDLLNVIKSRSYDPIAAMILSNLEKSGYERLPGERQKKNMIMQVISESIGLKYSPAKQVVNIEKQPVKPAKIKNDVKEPVQVLKKEQPVVVPNVVITPKREALNSSRYATISNKKDQSEIRPFKVPVISTARAEKAVSQSQYVEKKRMALRRDKRELDDIKTTSGQKALAYYSREFPVNNNGIVKRLKHGRDELIWCRHLSEAYANGIIGRGKNKFNTVNHVDRLSRSQDIPDDLDLERKYNGKCSREAYYFSTDNFSKALVEASKSMVNAPDGAEKSYLLNTTHHSMAIRIKKRGDGATLYFYNPNQTNRHRKLVLTSFSDLKDIKVRDLVSEYTLYGEFTSRGDMGCLLSTDVVAGRDQSKVNVFGHVNSQLIYMLLRNGHYGHPGSPTVNRKNASLYGLVDGTYALQKAVLCDQKAAIQSYLQDMMNLKCSSEQKMNLLWPKGAKKPLIEYAFTENKLDIVKLYLKAVVSSNMDYHHKRRLIHLYLNGDATTLLGLVLKRGFIEIGVAYLDAVINANGITKDQKLSLIAQQVKRYVNTWSLLDSNTRQKLLDASAGSLNKIQDKQLAMEIRNIISGKTTGKTTIESLNQIVVNKEKRTGRIDNNAQNHSQFVAALATDKPKVRENKQYDYLYKKNIKGDVPPNILPERKPLEKTEPSHGNYLKEKRLKLKKQDRDLHVHQLANGSIALSYFYKSTPININGEVERRHNNKKELIWCRHLAEGYATGVFGRGKDKFGAIDSRRKLAQHAGIPSEEGLRQKYNHQYTRQGYYFDLNNSAQAIEASIKPLWSMNTGDEKSFTLATSQHAMALRVVKKQGSLVICFYDPNCTNTHKRIVVQKPEDLKYISIKDILSEDQINDYFHSLNSQSACIISTDTVKTQNECSVKVFGGKSEDLLQLLMMNGHYGHSNIPGYKINRQTYRGITDGIYALETAFANEKGDAIKKYLSDLMNSGISEKDIVEVISPIKAVIPAPYLAYVEGESGVVKIYLDSVLSSSLSYRTKKNLLHLAERKRGRFALVRALIKGHFNVGKVYMESILSSKALSENEKLDILSLDRNSLFSKWSAITIANRRKLWRECQGIIEQYLSGSAQKKLNGYMFN